MQMKTLAEQLVAARKACGMTQEQLSEALNMSRQAISHWETGRSLPDAEMLVKISKVLKYNFVTSEALTEEPVAEAPAVEVPVPDEEAAAAQRAPEAPGKPVWQQPVLYWRMCGWMM